MTCRFLFFIMFGLLHVVDVYAQSPNNIPYNISVNNSTGTPVANRTIGMRISIRQNSSSGTIVYSETQTPTTDVNAVASIQIGSGSVVSGSFASIAWSNGPYFVQTEIDLAGGTNYTIDQTEQFVSVPYALYASNSASGGSGGSGSSGGFTRYVGELYQGGVICHVWKDPNGTEHGLIVGVTNVSSGRTWSASSSTLNANAFSYSDGNTNSVNIVDHNPSTSTAAKDCLDWVSRGKDDWYLPSVEEAYYLMRNRATVNEKIAFLGGDLIPSTGNMWLSTLYYDGNLNTILIYSLLSGVGDKSASVTNSYVVRAMRKF